MESGQYVFYITGGVCPTADSRHKTQSGGCSWQEAVGEAVDVEDEVVANEAPCAAALCVAQICLFNLQFTSKSAWFLKCVNSMRGQLCLGKAHKEISFLISDSPLLLFARSDRPSVFLLHPRRSRTNSISPSADEWKSVSTAETRSLPLCVRPKGRIRQHTVAREISDLKLWFFFLYGKRVWKKAHVPGLWVRGAGLTWS